MIYKFTCGHYGRESEPPLNSGQGETIPVFDAEDARLTGWEIGYAADNGDLAIQVRCHCGCGVVHALRLPPGAFIRCDGPEMSTMDAVQFHGPMQSPVARVAEIRGVRTDDAAGKCPNCKAH